MYKWEEIYLELKGNIINNIYKDNEFLPTENQLCIKYKVSRETIRKIYSKLETENYIFSIKNKGRVKRRLADDLNSNLKSFRELTKNKYFSKYNIVFEDKNKIEIIVKRFDSEGNILIYAKSKIYKKFVNTKLINNDILDRKGILNFIKNNSTNKLGAAVKRFVISADDVIKKEVGSDFLILNDCLVFDSQDNIVEHSLNFYNPNFFEYYLFEKYNEES